MKEADLDPEVAIAADGLASVYWQLGYVADAESMFERVIAIRERVYGSEHIMLSYSLDSLANLH